MNNYAVLTAVGTDKTGLVDEISGILTISNINIEDSRMAVLGGEFAIIMLLSGGIDIEKTISGQKDTIEKTTGLSISIKQTIPPEQRKIKPSIPHRLSSTSMDHPGIIHEITRILHNHNTNIESMETNVNKAPISAAPIFNMRCIINIPMEEKVSGIRADLEKLGDNMNFDIRLESIDSF